MKNEHTPNHAAEIAGGAFITTGPEAAFNN